MSEPALHVLDGARFTSGWDALWTRDQWHERELPHGHADDGPGRGVILHFEGLAQPWLKEAAKRWARARLLAATAPQSMKGYLIELRAFSRWLLEYAPQAHSPAAISRELLTDYILFVRASPSCLRPNSAASGPCAR